MTTNSSKEAREESDGTIPFSSMSKEESERQPIHKRVLEVLVGIGIFAASLIGLLALALFFHAIGFDPGHRSFLGIVPFWDLDGMSIFERICQLFGW